MKKGFTLLELLIVVAILGILVLLFVVNNKGSVADAEVKKNLMNQKMMGNAMHLYYELHHDLPISNQNIDAKHITEEFKKGMLKKFESLGKTMNDAEWNEMVKHFKKIDAVKLKTYLKGHKEDQDYFLVDESAPYFKGYAFSYHSLYKDKKKQEIFDIPFQHIIEGSVSITKAKMQLLGGNNIFAYLNGKKQVFSFGSDTKEYLGGSTNAIPVQKEGGGNLESVESIHMVGPGAFAFTTDHKIYAWGYNGNASLGLGNDTTVNYARELKLPDGLTAKDVKKVSGRNTAVVMLLQNGKVLGWGENYSRELGDAANETQKTPVYLKKGNGEVFSNVKDVEMAETGSAFLLEENGDIYVAGENFIGQLGIDPEESRNFSSFKKSDLLSQYGKRIVKMHSGAMYFAALLDDGTVLVAGDHRRMIMDPESTKEAYIPRVIKDKDGKEIKNVKDIALSGHAAFLLQENGDVLGWGENHFGELGFDPREDFDKNSVPFPQKVTNIQADYIATGLNIIMIFKDEEIYLMGRNEYGRINDSGEMEVFVPQKLDLSRFEN